MKRVVAAAAVVLLGSAEPAAAQYYPNPWGGIFPGWGGGLYTRGNFASLTSLPPLGLVKSLGSFTPPAYVQEFPDAAKTSGVKYALASGSPTTFE